MLVSIDTPKIEETKFEVSNLGYLLYMIKWCASLSCPILPIEVSIANGFGQMVRQNLLTAL